MPLKHKNSDEANKHTPKGFDNASNFSRLLRDEIGTSRYTRETTLPPALNFVDGANVPPTTVLNDVYVLIDNGGGAVNANWGGASYNDWVRFNGTNWGSVTPTAGDICYDQTAGIYKIFSTSWAQFIPDVVNIYTTDDSLTGNRDVDLAGFNLGFTGGNVGVGTATPDASSILDVDSTTQGSRAFPRVTTAQMNAISTPATNLVVFNTDLNSLMRYNGSAWVSMASGYGLASVADSSGIPTFYASLSSAVTACASGGTVYMHTNITESGAVSLTVNKSITIDLQGNTYTLDNAGSVAMVTNSNVNGLDINIINGTLKRTVGAGNLLNIGGTSVGGKVNLSGLRIISDTASYLLTARYYDVYGGYFSGTKSIIIDSDASLSNFVYNGAGTLNSFVNRSQITNGFIRSTHGTQAVFVNYGGRVANLTVYATSIGITSVGDIDNCVVYSTGGNAIYSYTSGARVTNSKGYSSGGIGINCGGGFVDNSQGYSTFNVGIYCGNGSNPDNILNNCVGWSSASFGIYLFNGATANFCTATSTLNTTSGHAIQCAYNNNVINSCILNVANAGAYGVNGGNEYVLNCSGKGMTTLLNLTSNLQTNTTDSYGNILIG